MNNTDQCQFVVALGLAAAVVILAVKADGTGAKEILVHAADACKEWAITAGGR